MTWQIAIILVLTVAGLASAVYGSALALGGRRHVGRLHRLLDSLGGHHNPPPSREGAHPAGSGAVHGAVETTQGVPRPTREYGSYRITVRDGEPFRIGSAGDGMAERVTRYSSALSLIAVQGCESSPVCRLGSEAQTKWCDACIATDALRQPVPISPAAERRRLAEQIEAMTYGDEVQW